MQKGEENTAQDEFAWQLERVAVWEDWWRKRLESVRRPPPAMPPGEIIRALDKGFLDYIRAAEQKLTGTTFDARENAFYTSDDTGAIKAYTRLWETYNDLWQARWRQRTFEAQINLSLDAAPDLGMALRDWNRASLNFCRTAEPFFMASRLSVYNKGRDVWPMLTGFATAQLYIGRNRLPRLKALEEIFWQEHPRDQIPAYKKHLRPILHEQALFVVPTLLPFLSRRELAIRTAFDAMIHLRQIIHDVPLRSQNMRETKTLLLAGAASLCSSSARAAALPKGNHNLLLLPFDREALSAISRLHLGVDHQLIQQNKGQPRLPPVDIPEGSQVAESLLDWTSKADDPLAMFEQNASYQALLAELKPAERETFYLLASEDDYSIPEIAQLLGDTPAAVEQRIKRARRRMRKSV